MRGLTLALLVATLTPAPAAAAPAKATEAAAPDPERHTLHNGLRVHIEQDARSPVVAMQLCYDVGKRDEPADRGEIAHLVEHLMYRPFAHAPQGYAVELQQLGGDFGAHTTPDETCYEAVVPPAALPRLLWLEAARMTALADGLEASALDAEREIVRSELSQRFDDQLVGEAWLQLQALVQGDHPYGRGLDDFRAGLAATTLDDAIAFHRAHYRPDVARLALVGDISPAVGLAYVNTYFGMPAPAEPRVRPPLPPDVGTPGSLHVAAEASRRFTLVGWPSPPVGSSDAQQLGYAASLLEELVGPNLGDGRGFAYLQVGQDSLEHGGVFYVLVSHPADQSARSVVDTLSEELINLVEGNYPNHVENVVETRAALAGRAARDSPATRASRANQRWGRDKPPRKRRGVDREALAAAVHRWLKPPYASFVQVAAKADEGLRLESWRGIQLHENRR